MKEPGADNMAGLYWQSEDDPGSFWPTALKPGSAVGLFAPAHHFDRAGLERGVEIIRSWGLEVIIPHNLCQREKYLAGDDGHRLAIMEELMADEKVGALLAVRGGYGCQRLLPYLASRWKAWPAKPIYGFSDLTALHLARWKAAGVIGYHSPMAISLGKLEKRTRANLISQSDLRKSLRQDKRSGGWRFSPRQIMKKGLVKGRILGGNLTMVTALLGSPWLPDFEGAILLLEDIGEPAYRLDRLLITIRQSPIWKKAAGLVFGGFVNCGKPFEISCLLKEAAQDFDGPAVSGAPFGHLRQNRLFPIGSLAVLDARGYTPGADI